VTDETTGEATVTTWRLRLRDGTPTPHEVLLRAAPDAPLDALLTAFRERGFATSPLRVEGRAVAGVTRVGELGLVHGATVELGTDGYVPARREAGLHLVAVSGPEAGSWWRIPASGQLLVGRGNAADVQIHDALVSGRHAVVRVDAARTVTVEDLGSSNGTLVEGRYLTGSTQVALGSYVQIGSSVLTVLEVEPLDLPVHAPPSGGARPFQRHFREALEPLPKELLPPEPPDERTSQGTRSWWQYLLPMVTGAGFALVTGRWIFLLLMAVSPLALLIDYLRRQRTDERDRAKREAEHVAALAEHSRELERVQALERDRRRRAAVVGGEAVLMAELGHRRLWERTREDEDHLEVCIGLADQPSVVKTTKEDRERATLWAVPLSVSLPQTGSLLVSGPMHRARSVGRSMLLNLAATHSPLDLRVIVLTTGERAGDWNWVRWLPHAFSDGGAAQVHSTPEHRDAAVTSLLRQLDAREEGLPGVPTVVVIDGAAHVDGTRLTTLLSRGADHGIHGIVLDAQMIPEGVRGTLTLGEQPDEGVFASRHIARVGGILTAELSVPWADRAARSMAGLRPPAEEGGSAGPEVHLTDLVADAPVDAAWVAGRWAAQSPTETVTVGLAGRTPVEVDIVRHGPHAIVGGATRSGKTEFLLTWLTALCLANTPDDLAIIVADFKGGVDHVQTARLPHVISLVTNQDIRAFERTLVMLEAEIERRQDVLATAGTSNLEAYRAARQRDDSLVPVPRLLVVVDEFSELRQADKEGGRGYMGRLESVARVGAGLGVHLVLVTQNFAGGQLSDQIEGQVGMGVCFRVEKAEHSKVVLDSSAAAGIPADRPGRAWARLRGADLTEFQSARVAGRRRELSTGDEVELTHVPFSTLPYASAAPPPGAVPHDESDLAVLIDVAREAAAGARPPVPWPGELSPDLHLASVLEGADRRDGEIPIGTADVPERLRQQPAVLRDADEQVTVIGSSEATARVLVTAAVSTALTTPVHRAHLYAIDLEGNTLQPLEGLPHVGAVACLNDDLAIRIVGRLREEAGRRRSLFEEHGVSDLGEYEQIVGQRLPRVRLLLHGADRLLGSSEGDVSPLLRPVSALSGEAPGTGVGLLLSGSVSVFGKRLTQRATRRLVLTLNDPSNYGVVGVPRDRAVELEAAGRAWDVTEGHLVQVARVSSVDTATSEVVDALGARLRDDERLAIDAGPMRLPEVRWPLPWARLDPDSVRVPDGYGAALPIGVDTDTGHWSWIDAEEDGPVLAIGGGGRTGRSTTLLTLARLARQLGWEVHGVAPTRRSPLHGAELGHPVAATPSMLEPTDTATLVVVDDVNRLPDDDDGLDKLVRESTGPILLALAGPPEIFGRRMGALRGLPEPRVTLTLAPSSSTGTGNVRLPDHLRVDPRPGRGVLWSAGEFQGIQVPA
jgi:DNA segregation ATPase FtsK/SpoIIIE, S-DNA-T family